jgi:catechol 2,3-dioxygenase-like lactoylglutathione lyase family enzyme
MKIRSLDHVGLLVQDVERSRHFYVQVPGLEEIPRPSTFDFPGAWLHKGSALIHLVGEAELGRVDQLYAGTSTPDELSRGYGTHIAFEVDDLEDAENHLKAHTVAIVGDPRPRGDGVTPLYVCDPDGSIVELFADKKQAQCERHLDSNDAAPGLEVARGTKS